MDTHLAEYLVNIAAVINARNTHDTEDFEDKTWPKPCNWKNESYKFGNIILSSKWKDYDEERAPRDVAVCLD